MDVFYPQVLAGFIMVMSEEGDIIYLTENVSVHVGITQVCTRLWAVFISVQLLNIVTTLIILSVDKTSDTQLLSLVNASLLCSSF